MHAGAAVSNDGLYRYHLWRRWDWRPLLVFVMLNPSTADAEFDDPTIRRCIGFARRELYGGIEVVNLFALRVTKPAHLFDGSIAEPNGPENVAHVVDALEAARNEHRPVVAAWGASTRIAASEALGAIHACCFSLQCLGTTVSGSPKHPLYLKRSTSLREWQSQAIPT